MEQNLLNKINIIANRIKIKVPGEIELNEVKNLIYQCSKIKFNKNIIAVEIGALFGKSTLAILEGLQLNNSNNKKLHVYDIFEIKKNDQNYNFKYLFNILKPFGLEKALVRTKKKINFENIYNFNTQNYPKSLLKTFRRDFKKINKIKQKIGFLHLDGPKNIDDYTIILNKFFNNFFKGSIIIFQHYFYSKSVDQYAIVEFLIKKKKIKYLGFSQTSLVVELINTFSKSEIKELKKEYKKNTSLVKKAFLRNEKILKKILMENNFYFYIQIVTSYFYFLKNKDFKFCDILFERYLKKVIKNKNIQELISRNYALLNDKYRKTIIL